MSQQFSRADLYKLVWSKPMTEVAKDLGVSDVAIGKACKRIGVPRPPTGYWQQLRAGKDPVRARLGVALKNAPESVWIGEDRPITPATVLSVTDEAKRREALPENRITVRATLRNCHHLVRTTADVMAGRQPYDGMLHSIKGECLDLRVSKANLQRALRIYDAIIRSAAERGWETRIKTNGYHSRTIVQLGSEELEIKLEEPTQRHEAPLKPGESYAYPRYTFEATGILRLRLHHHLKGVVQSVSDGKTLLEDKINEVMVRFASIEEGYRLWRLEIEERNSRYEEECRREEAIRERTTPSREAPKLFRNLLRPGSMQMKPTSSSMRFET